MVNWSHPKEIVKDSDIFSKLILALFGVYIWELFTTCDFEWSLMSGRRRFRWPLVRQSRCFQAMSICTDITLHRVRVPSLRLEDLVSKD
ncbi:hypothetical protein H0H81_001959 [Sphagnurus paluster]|uniref:Uncharacterized protein n=1 Tax=Sphagnurus paluster TaxID=117069 RepID=A0A9P7GW31_9AGAR|nr:hypothetical protein H0H81_001959 [Sphagnurus paluster]